jgi:hypothetical protein
MGHSQGLATEKTCAFINRQPMKRGKARVFVGVSAGKQLPSWLEQNQRQTKWFKADEAAKVVKEPQLRLITRSLNCSFLK